VALRRRLASVSTSASRLSACQIGYPQTRATMPLPRRFVRSPRG
jgi:hypothetical protein